MLVRVTCACKKGWFVDDSLAGTAVGCKSCGASTIVPGDAAPASAAALQPGVPATPAPCAPTAAAPYPASPAYPATPAAHTGEFFLAYELTAPLGGEKKLFGVYRQGDALLFLRLCPVIDGFDCSALARDAVSAVLAAPENAAAKREEPKLRARLAAIQSMSERERLLEATSAPNILATARNLTQVHLEPYEDFRGPWATNAQEQTRACLKLRAGNRKLALDIQDPGDLRLAVRWLWELLGPDAVLVTFLMEPPLPPVSSQPPSLRPVSQLLTASAAGPPNLESSLSDVPPGKRAGQSAPNKLQTWGGAAASVAVFGVLIFGRGGCRTAPPITPPAYVAASPFPELGNPTPMRLEGTVLPAAITSPVTEARFNEVVLRRGDRSTKLWIYRPASTNASRLPCVLVAPAGTRLIHGMGLGEGDRPEHISYVRAGMIVVAYELDGSVPENAGLTDTAAVRAVSEFMASEAGLSNGQDALDYALAKIPEVDSYRIYTAGHSSAATVALHLAQHEPRIKAVAAYAPCTDVESRLGDEIVGPLDKRIKGFRAFVKASSPLRNAVKLRCPAFLFHAEDDNNVPISESEAFAAEVRKTNPNLTFHRVRSGGHYNSMIDGGMGHAIGWMMQLPNVQNWQPVPIGLRARNVAPAFPWGPGVGSPLPSS